MKKLPLKELLDRYLAGKCTPEEQAWVENWYVKEGTSELPISDDEFERDIQDIYKDLPRDGSNKSSTSDLLKVAAVFILGLVVIAVFFNLDNKKEEKDLIPAVTYDVEPGGNKATLRLADGSIIVLDDMNVGQIYQHKDIQIKKSKDGQIEYLLSSEKGLTGINTENRTSQNEISTPPGGNYQIILPDGTKVWLNSTSTLTYPHQFSEHARMVTLSGEAYFEVQKHDVPFFVQTNKQRVRVLGTHFNVKAYIDEEEVQTTLLEGSVKITPTFKSEKGQIEDILLKPGEQAQLKDNSIAVINVNTAQSVAWKNGIFSFDGTGIEAVMREFSRWYGVEVVFDGKVPDTKLWGEVHKNIKASQALMVLDYFSLKHKIVNENGVSRIEISEKQ